MESLQREDIVRITHAATESVFSTMLQLPAVPQQTRSDAGSRRRFKA